MIKKFLKAAGVKNEQDFYKKYPSEAAFFKAHPEMKKFKQGGQQKKLKQLTSFEGDIDNVMPKAQFGDLMWGSAPTISGAPANQPMLNPNAAPIMMDPNQTGTFAQQVAGSQNAINPFGKPKFDLVGKLGGAAGIGQLAGDLISGIQGIKEQKKQKKEAEKFMKVAGLVERAAGLQPELANRRYVRPEDIVTEPDQLFPTYGVGTNYLAQDGAMIGGNPSEIQNTYAPGTLYDDLGYEPLDDSDQIKQFRNGGIPKAQTGFDWGSFASGGGNDLAGGLGQMFAGTKNSAWGNLGGKTLGTVGSIFGGPLGGMIGNFVGQGLLGGLDTTAKKIEEYNKKGQASLDRAGLMSNMQALNRGFGAVKKEGGWVSHDWQPQVITKFGDNDVNDLLAPDPMMDTLRTGGNIRQNYRFPQDNMALGGELKTHWGGKAETMSYNPYLPDGGETIMFRGQSHDESDGKGRTGIGVTYGENPVEVERGEPALKLKDGSSGDSSLVVYGDLKINKNSSKEIGDPSSYGKKFKKYVEELSKEEEKQNKIVEKTTDFVDKVKGYNRFGSITMNSGLANLIGANMNLKSIADRKINAAAVQNAINDTAEEMGLKASDLAVGKITKEKNNKNIAQTGTKLDPRGWYYDKNGQLRYSMMRATGVGYIQSGHQFDKPPDATPGVGPVDPGNAPAPADAAAPPPKKKRTSSSTSSASANIQEPDPSKFASDADYLDALYEAAQKQKKGPIVEKFQKEFHKRHPDFALDISRKAKKLTTAGKRSGLTEKELMEGTDAMDILHKNNEDGIFGERTIQYKKYLDENKPKPKLDTPELVKKTPDAKPKESDVMTTTGTQTTKFNWGLLASQIMPYLRPTDAMDLEPGQLYKEMMALATNQLEPVEAQLYTPELATPYDISLQDQLNEITANDRAAQRMAQGDPSALALINSQSNLAKSKVLADQFRMNQAQKAAVYDDNRKAIMDARKTNLEILDKQYERQALAKSKTKETALEAVGSISDKIAKNKLENRTLQVYENLYNYRYDPRFRAVNWNAPHQYDIPQVADSGLIPIYDTKGKLKGYQAPDAEDTAPTTGKFGKKVKPVAKKSNLNSSIVKAFKNL